MPADVSLSPQKMRSAKGKRAEREENAELEDAKVSEGSSPQLAPPPKKKAQIPAAPDAKKISGTKQEERDRFLSSLYSRARERGYGPSDIIDQVMRITLLEKKYGMSFPELRDSFDRLAKEISKRNKELQRLEAAKTAAEARNARLLEQNSVNAEIVKDYVRTKKVLSSLGLDMGRLQELTSFLEVVKQQGFNANQVIVKLNEIDDLEAKKKTLSEDLEKAKKNLEDFRTNIQAEKESLKQEIRKGSEEGVRQAFKQANTKVESAISTAESSVAKFASDLKALIESAQPDLKTVSQTLEAGERLGKFKAILPLLELMDGDGSGKAKETDALIALWNIASRFNLWLIEHYGEGQKEEIAEPLGRLIEAVNEEIQRVGTT